MFKLKTLLGAFICGVLALGTGIGLNVASNNGVLENARAVATVSPYVHTFGSGQISQNGGTANLSGVDWTYGTSTYVGVDGNGRGVQIGSSKKPQTDGWALTTPASNFDGDIFKVVVESCTSGSATLSVLTDDVQNEVVNLTGDSTKYTFDIATTPMNDLSISLTARSKAMYIKSIEVYFSKGDVGTLDSLTYTGEVTKQYENKPFDPNGLTFTANYTNGSMEVPLSNIAFTPEILTKDTKEVVATYETVICKIPVVVGALDTLTYEGTVTKQFDGQPFNPTGLTFTAYYTNDTQFTVPLENITFTPEVLTTDTEIVVATFEGKTVEIPVIVVAETRIVFGSHPDFATWDNSYTTRTLDYPDVTFTWESANKQSGTITNMPVSKGKSLIITSKVKSIKSVELGFKQWTNKEQTIEAKVGGVVVSTMNFPHDGTALVVNITETNVKEAVFNATNFDNQIGWEYARIEYYEADPDVVAIEKFIKNYLHPEIATDNNADTGACLGADGYYEKAKAAFNNLTPEQRRMFIEDVLFSAMYARLSAWARANHETFDASTNMLVSANVNTNNIISNEGYLTVIIAVSMLAVSLIAIFAFTKKKAIHR